MTHRESITTCAAALGLVLLACGVLPPAHAESLTAGASASVASPDDAVMTWVNELRNEVQALRNEGAQPLIAALNHMRDAEANLLDRLRTAPGGPDAMLPEMATTWSDNAALLAEQAKHLPEVRTAQSHRLAKVRGMLGDAQQLRRNLDRQVEAARASLAALRRAQAEPGTPNAVKAEMQAAALAAELSAREGQARLVAGFVTQANQVLVRLDEADGEMDLLATAIDAHRKVLSASAELARTRLVAREVLQTLSTMADQMESLDGVFSGLTQEWQELDDVLRRLGDLPSLAGGHPGVS